MTILDEVENLKSVLCDPEGHCCIHGSNGDMKIIDDALESLTNHGVQAAQAPGPIQRRVKYYSGHSVMPSKINGYYLAKVLHGFPEQESISHGPTPDAALENAIQEALNVRGEA